MADNKHTTLTSLFDDIADEIRLKSTGSKEGDLLKADDFDTLIHNLETPAHGLSDAVVTSGSGSATISDPSYNSSTGKFDQSASGTVAAPSVGTAGYISSTRGIKNTSSISGSKSLNKVGTGVTISGDSTKAPTLKRTAKPSGDSWTDAASGAATTTKPSSGPYVQIDADANTGTLTATPKVTSEGYGTTSQYSATAGTQTVGASKATTAYVPITEGTAGTPSASKGAVSSNSVTVTPSVTNTTGWITGGTKTGTGVTVSASELVSGNKALSSGTASQSNIDVTNYATVSISPIGSGAISAADSSLSGNSFTPTLSYNSTSGKFDYSGSANATGTAHAKVTTDGYLTSSDNTSKSLSASVSATGSVNKVGTGVDITGTTTKAPVLKRTAKPSGDTWTDAASGAATTTKPTSGAYVRIDSDANTGTLTATPKVTSTGYGTTTSGQYGATASTATVGAAAATTAYVPISAGSVSNPTATKGSVSNHSISVTPKVTSSTGWITGQTNQTGTAVTVSASELVSGNKSLSSSASAQSNIDVTNYATVSISAITPSSIDNTIISGSAFEESTDDYAWKTTVTIPAGYHTAQTLEKTFSSVFPAPESEATAGQVLLGYELFDHDGKKITGTMPNNTTGGTITSQGGTYTIPAGYTSGGTVTANINSGSHSGTVSTHSISTTPVVTPLIGGTITDISTTTAPSSGTDGTDYWTLDPGGSVTTTGVSTAKATATIGTAGYISTSSSESVASTKNITPTVAAGTNRYISKGSYSASGTASSGSASISASGFTGASSATTHYVSLSTSSGSVTPKATIDSAGYLPTGNKTGSAVSVSVSGNGNKVYIPDGAYSASGTASGGSASIAATGFTGSSSATSHYVTLSTSAGSVTPKATIGTAGYLETGNKTGTAVSVSVSGNGNKIYVPDGSHSGTVSSHSITTTPVVTPSIGGTSTSISSTTKPSGTDGTDYWTLDPGGSVTTTGVSTAKAKASIGTEGYISADSGESSGHTVNITPSVAEGTNRYISKATTSTTQPTASATNGTASITKQPSASASTSVTGMVTTSTNTGYSVSASASSGSGTISATGGSASTTAGSVTVGAGYNPSSVTASVSASSASGTSASTTEVTKSASDTKYIQKGALSASVSSNSGGSASMAATGFTAASSATDYYVTLSTSAGSVKAKASVGTEGYVKTETNETAATSVSVSGNGTKLYIPAGSHSGTVSTHSISTTPVVTPSIGGTVTDISSTSQPSGTNGTDYWTLDPGGSVTTTGVSTAKATATIGNVGYIASSSGESAADTKNITPTVAAGTNRYITKATTSKTNPTASATNGTASVTKNPSASASVTATGFTPLASGTSAYYVTASASSASGTVSATGGSASTTEGSVTVGAGYNPSAVTASVSASSASGTSASTTEETASDSKTIYIPAGTHSGTVSTHTVDKPAVTYKISGTATDISSTTKPSGTDGTDYWTLDPDGDVTNGTSHAKAKASIGTAGYISSDSAESGDDTKSIGVTVTSGTNRYISKATTSKTNPTSSATNGTATITKQPSASASVTSTGIETSSTDTSYYVTASASSASGTISATGGSASTTAGSVTVGAGYNPSSVTASVAASSASGTSASTTEATASDSKTVYIKAGSVSVSATKGTVSNHSISVTPEYTNTAGYIPAHSTAVSGDAATVSASELVSGNKRLSSSTSDQTNIDVTNYETVSISAIASGTAGTPVATKGKVSGNSITITPSVTNESGYISGGRKTGTAVTVSANELVSGNKLLSSSTSDQSNIDVTNYETVSISKIASADPAFTGGTVSGSTSLSGSNVTLSDTDNGISVSSSGTANRTAVTYNGVVAGYVSKSDGDTASAAPSSAASLTGSTKYISGVSLPVRKKIEVTAIAATEDTSDVFTGNTGVFVTNNAFRVAHITNGANAGVEVPGNNGVIRAYNNAGDINISGTNAGTVWIESNTGTIDISSGSSSSGVVTIKAYSSSTLTSSKTIVNNGKWSHTDVTSSGTYYGEVTVSASDSAVTWYGAKYSTGDGTTTGTTATWPRS